MIIVADPETQQRWERRGSSCSAVLIIESLDHARWLLDRHYRHPPTCRPLICALGYDTVVCG